MRSLLPLRFDGRLFAGLVGGFVLFTVIGTLSHEAGHYVAGRWRGFTDGRIHYAYTYIGNHPLNDSIHRIFYVNYDAITQHRDFPQKPQYERMLHQRDADAQWALVGGPVQTLLVGTAGLLLLAYRRQRSGGSAPFTLSDWLLVGLALFWLRQPANLVMKLGNLALTGQAGHRDDETRLARLWHLPEWSLLGGTAALGGAGAGGVSLRSGAAAAHVAGRWAGGGTLGYATWLGWLGPVLMP